VVDAQLRSDDQNNEGQGHVRQMWCAQGSRHTSKAPGCEGADNERAAQANTEADGETEL